MTESYISPQDVAQFYSSQDRVRNWITTHADHVFTSPNLPPSELDNEEGLSSPPSDVESSHSVPPVLENIDGREPLAPYTTKSPKSSLGRKSRSKSNQLSNPSHERSRVGNTPPYSPVLISDSRREREKLRSHSPEEIQILPSASDEIPPVPSGSHHSRSRSLPRDAFSPSRNHDPMPPVSPYGPTAIPMQTEMSPPVIPMLPSPGPYAGLARTQPPPLTPWNPYTNAVRTGPMMPPTREHFKHNPPSIIYAPSNNSRTNYHPPAILSYRPVTGPNRIFYSHSVPPAQAQIAHAGYPSVHGTFVPQEEPRRSHHHKHSSESRHSSSRHRDKSVGSAKSGKSGKSSKSKDTTSRRSGRDRTHSLPLEQEYPPSPTEHHHHHHRHHHHRRPPSPADSQGSGSTYYVLPTARQKVHVLVRPRLFFPPPPGN
ncbi:hypothetical protein C8R42DRAFT_419323 [Lentinula raphanica]|nr:hypothetical protein C8R42DRAFT_419323 [Lentinula raphanica]